MAEALAEQTGHQHWLSLDTLAVAYAGAGRFAEAVGAATRAFEQAERARAPEVTNVAARLNLFRNQQTYVEP